MSTNSKPKRTRTYRSAPVTIVPMLGPGSPARCVRCGEPFADGEHWRKMTRDGYSVGIHDSCSRGGEVAR